MRVKVQIDLTVDHDLIDVAQNDSKIFGLLRIYEAIGDEKYLDQIGQRLWDKSTYAELIIRFCDDDIFDFIQLPSWLFEFETSHDNAVMMKTSASSPSAVRIVHKKRTPHSLLSFKKSSSQG